jgi:CRISPR-associated protein Cmr2
MNHLFLFTISPVQPFIASARKTRDLYAGSQILSEMTKAAAREAASKDKDKPEDIKLELIFPTKTTGKSFPNRFVAKIEGNFSDEILQKKGYAIKKAAFKVFEELAKKLIDSNNINWNSLEVVKEKYRNEKDFIFPTKESIKKSFKQQIENYWDINWLFHPYEKDNYKAAYEEIEPLMAALKNERIIKNDFVEAGRKCSIDGQNNALFRGEDTKNKRLEMQAVEVNQGAWLKPNEGLSAISLVKRAYEAKDENKDFPSTIKVALKKQLAKIDKQLLDSYKELFSDKYPNACIKLLSENYIEKIKLNNSKDNWTKVFNEEFWIEDNLTEKNIPNLTQLGIAKDVHSKYLKSVLKDRYYALIAFDADKMGKLLSGETRIDKTSNLEDFQGKVSGLLAAYSNWIYTSKELKDKIDVVYAGGDDFLGFVCLHDLFEVGNLLRVGFDEEVNKKLKNDIEGDFTFSMGITIAHYKTPLSIVIQITREMEKVAKDENKGDRDAFAIAVLKHSGESHRAYYKWYEKDEDGKESMKAWNALEKLIDHLQNDCSETFIRVLEREFRLLQNDKGEIENADMMTLELGRLARRALNENGKREQKGKEIKDNVLKLISMRKEQKRDKSYADFSNSFEAMKVAMFLKRQSKDLKKREPSKSSANGN